nr:right-handed parallel beta-helix repeat-containing protein [Candidatus Sigynarchaeota archaeon]
IGVALSLVTIMCMGIVIGSIIPCTTPLIYGFSPNSTSCIPFTENDSNSTGTTYYVSASQGSDSNDGLAPDRPWQSLGKVSNTIFNPFDAILLHSGDTWVNESLILHGSGNTSAWITLGSYMIPGVSPPSRPRILPGFDALWGIHLENVGGWHIKNIEIGECMTGITLFQNGSTPVEGLWIEDCHVHDIEGVPIPQKEDFSMVFPDLWCSMGIVVYTYSGPVFSRVGIENIVLERTDLAFRSKWMTDLFLENLTVIDSYRGGVWIEETRRGIMQNSRIMHTGSQKGMWWGTAGIQLDASVNITVQDCEVGFSACPACPDGIGLDYEGSNQDCVARRLYIHDCERYAFLIMTNADWGVDNKNCSILECVVVNCGHESPMDQPAFLRHTDNNNVQGTIADNLIVLISPFQRVSFIDTRSPRLTDDLPDEYILRNNTVLVDPVYYSNVIQTVLWLVPVPCVVGMVCIW